MRTMWWLIMLAACDAGAPSCKDAVAKAASHGGGDHTAIVKMCEDKQWSGDLRGCLARATSPAKADACMAPVIADVREAEAELAAKQAADEAKAALDKVEATQKELAAEDQRIAAEVDDVINSTTAKDRSEAQAVLEALRKKKAELEARMELERRAVFRTDRAKGVHISRECLDNPLAVGCS
jgi:hypothetical protein